MCVSEFVLKTRLFVIIIIRNVVNYQHISTVIKVFSVKLETENGF